ncbi:E3 ubiquitin-protein ligase RNF135 isoform X1 [Ochotona curzoniae]|uniref:E3 ubiquitin-protein ligase RNF135 isoform X1 n=1 Tax=Ochotona curzoniae TaxID=130825 RepID=UPI001B347112|nr:E3 ubiquitin-protein ligase RNF135 isoform X1 [Ochotona curzoniae]
MAGSSSAPAVPVWLAEDDLCCIICQGLLAWPVTLPCGHSFCKNCLTDLWDKREERTRSRWCCPTCREALEQRPALCKNTLLQDLVDKYSSAACELEDGGPAPAASPTPKSWRSAASPRVVTPRNLAAVGEELVELVEQLVDTVRSLQSHLPTLELGPDPELSTLAEDFSSGVDLPLASGKQVTSSAPEGKMSNILRNLGEIQEKLRENFMRKEAAEEQMCGSSAEDPAAPSPFSCPTPDQNCPASNRVSRFAQWAISPTFDLRSASLYLQVSEDQRTVTVSRHPLSYSWSCERFSVSQIFCSQALSLGRQYWEVDTNSCSHWAVGVASWEMNRGQILGRTKDSWCLEWKGTGQLAVWSMNKETLLGSDRPGVVGIWLDLDERKLAFYAVASEERLMYECEVPGSCPLYPAFWLYGLQMGNSLTIK